MSLSVIMPNFNHGMVISRALRSVLQQIPGATEIIVVDDASTDNSVELIQSIAEQNASIRIIRHRSNQGVAAAMRTGIADTSGEYLHFLAADDLVLPGLFAAAISALEANPAASFFCSDVAIIDRAGSLVSLRPFMAPQSKSGYVSPSAVRKLIRSSDNWFVGPSVIYRRKPLAAAEYFDVDLASVCDAMTVRLLAFRHGFYYASEILAVCSVAPETVSGRAAVSSTEGRHLINAASAWIERKYPEDVGAVYSRLFKRRLCFGMTRLRLVWQGARRNSETIAQLPGFNDLDRTIIDITSRSPALSSQLVLAWISLRLRPFGILPLLRAVMRHILFRSRHWARINRIILQVLRQ